MRLLDVEDNSWSSSKSFSIVFFLQFNLIYHISVTWTCELSVTLDTDTRRFGEFGRVGLSIIDTYVCVGHQCGMYFMSLVDLGRCN